MVRYPTSPNLLRRFWSAGVGFQKIGMKKEYSTNENNKLKLGLFVHATVTLPMLPSTLTPTHAPP